MCSSVFNSKVVPSNEVSEFERTFWSNSAIGCKLVLVVRDVSVIRSVNRESVAVFADVSVD